MADLPPAQLVAPTKGTPSGSSMVESKTTNGFRCSSYVLKKLAQIASDALGITDGINYPNVSRIPSRRSIFRVPGRSRYLTDRGSGVLIGGAVPRFPGRSVGLRRPVSASPHLLFGEVCSPSPGSNLPGYCDVWWV
ncbi:hypothetical protein [Acrocarpospora sp. B8E8]|uniref:hypothetical protein n=1 Tax=Acrocarpospora sp. B8E8 TaxID=3153572 RepID=UPI00325ED0E2